MRMLLLGISLVSALCFAQARNPRFNATPVAGQSTTAAMTLYVDPASGNDSSGCVSTGAAACKTVAAALAKVPARVSHNVTINLATGTYTDATIKIEGFTVDAGISFTIQGAQIAATVATGATTGTLTGVTAGSTSTVRATVVDSGQTWTVNDLRGKFFRTTSGSGTATYYPIISNTATDLVLAINSSNVVVGNTYEILTPGAVFSFTASGQVKGNMGGGSILLTDVSLSSNTNVFQVADGPTFGVRRAAISTASTSPLVQTASTISFISTYLTTGFNGTIATLSGTAILALSTSYFRSTSTSAATLFQAGENSRLSITSGTIEGAATAANSRLIFYGSTAPMPITAVFLDCASANQTALFLPGSNQGTSFVMHGGSVSFAAGPVVNGCGVAISVDRPAAVELRGGSSISNATTAFNVSNGGRIYFNSTTPTFSTVTNEIMLDGVGAAFATLVTYLTNAEYSILYR